MRVLHVLHTSLPNLSGYSIRANYIMRCQEELGLMTDVVTSAQHAAKATGPLETIEERDYYRTPEQPERRTGARELGLMHALSKRLDEVVQELRPDVLHAASPVLVGLPALRVARKHKLPLVYEVRDLWENASVDRGKWKHDSLPYKGARAMETILFKKADEIVVICEALAEEIAPRVAKDVPLSVVPNGVESSLFQPSAPSKEIIEKWGFAGKKVLGYIGAFQPYEGLDVLLRAIPALVNLVPEAHVMITGGGNALDAELQALAKELGVEEHVTFTGRVPHSEVQKMYSVVDLMVYPRISTRTTELTTPLKPLEAMALKIPVALSSTRAMRELVREGETGYLFRPGDPAELARVCAEALGDDAERKRRAEAARGYVETERHWPTIVSKYPEIYERAAQRAAKRR